MFSRRRRPENLKTKQQKRVIKQIFFDPVYAILMLQRLLPVPVTSKQLLAIN